MKTHPLFSKAIIAILVLAGLEAIALLKGIDGAAFGTVVAAIAGLGGYEIGKGRSRK